MNKKGSAIVESVMIFPMVILSLIALIYMMIYFYGHLEKRVDMHIMLRAESGKICDNMSYFFESESDATYYEKAQQLCSYDSVSTSNKGILMPRTKRIESRKYLIDEAELIRRTKVIGDIVAGDE